MNFSSLSCVSTQSVLHSFVPLSFIFYWAKAINVQVSLRTCCLQQLLTGRGKMPMTLVHWKFDLHCYHQSEPERWTLNVWLSLLNPSLSTVSPARMKSVSSHGFGYRATPTLFTILFFVPAKTDIASPACVSAAFTATSWNQKWPSWLMTRCRRVPPPDSWTSLSRPCLPLTWSHQRAGWCRLWAAPTTWTTSTCRRCCSFRPTKTDSLV